MTDAAPRILIVRTDRVGDVILTTPVARRLREELPQARICWLARAASAPVLRENPDLDEVLVDDEGPAAALARRLRRERFDIALIAFPRSRVCWATWRAGIPVRVGPLSKIYSLLLSRPVRQHRSAGVKHEADFNLELLQPLGIPFRRVPARLCLRPEEERQARSALDRRGVHAGEAPVVLHPGSGGSAPRWPLAYFLELAGRLRDEGRRVVLTAGPGEDYSASAASPPEGPLLISPASLREMAALLAQASLVVTNSTGPLHLAVAVGTPTVSVFSPAPACHPRRWGPYPAYPEGSGQHTVLIASAEDTASTGLASVTVDEVARACGQRLASRRPPLPL